MKYCYVILHYKNISDTIKCMESLKNTAGNDSFFIIVDNGSGDNTGEQLSKLYGKMKNCKVMLLPENVGFSAGNNAGYQYAREKLNPEYLIITNNDVVFYQKNFETGIERVYEQTNFTVLGPDIYIPNNQEHQNPIFQKGITVEQLEKEIEEYSGYFKKPEKFQKRLQLHYVKNRMCSKYPIIRYLNCKLRGKEDIDYRKEQVNVGLQGSCLIVSKKYIEKEHKMFDPEPFLYCEEAFLFFKCRKKGYKMVYSPTIGIKHEEAASFKNANKDNDERLKFMLEHHIRARKMLLEYIK